MGIGGLWNVPRTPDELSVWSFDHAAQHRIEIAAIYRDFGVTLTEYRLDPLNPNDFATWIYQHQVMENQRNSVLGIAGYDLTGVDWNDPASFEAFIFDNATIHQQAATILRL